MKKRILNFNVLFSIFLSLYFSLAVNWDYQNSNNISGFFIKFLIVFVISEIVFIILLNKLNKAQLFLKNNVIKKWEYLIYALFIIAIIVIAMIIAYPSIGTWDSIGLWIDHKAGNLSNWHPVIYVLLFHGLPILISDLPIVAVIFQVIFVFMGLMYLCSFIRKKYFNFWQTLLVLLTIILNPIFMKASVFVLKDIPFSWCIIVLTICLIQIINTEGEWLNKKINKILFLIVSIGILLLRHNGIVTFALTYIYSIIFIKKCRKFFATSFLIIISSFFVLTGPVYEYFDIGKSGGKNEAIGVVLNNLSYYYNNDADIDALELKVLHKLYPKYIWKELYHPRNFNDIKNYDLLESDCENFIGDCNTDLGIRLRNNFNDILKVWASISLKNPSLLVKSYLNVTSPIWEIKVNSNEFYSYYYDDFNATDKTKPNLKLRELFDSYSDFTNILFISSGEGLFIIIFSLLFLIKRNKFNFKMLLPFVPVLSNTIIIMLMITGEEYRLVYSQTICYIPLILYSFQKINKEEL